MAGVIGFVLVIAVVVSYYAYVAKENVPRWGAENERAWDRKVGESMVRLARDAAGGIGTHASVSSVVPGHPDPKTFEVPLLGRTEPVAPSGTLTFHTECSGWSVDATVGTVSAVGFPYGSAADQRGCLDFRSQPVYSSAWGYRYENGALLRVESDKAVMVAGPPLKLRVLSTPSDPAARYEVALTLVDLRGPGASASATRNGIPLDLVAGGAASSASEPVLVDAAKWTFETQYPEAWKNWLNQRFRGAGFDTSRNAACTTADGAGSGPCGGLAIAQDELVVVLGGPKPPTQGSDLSLSLAQGMYDVAVR